MNNSQSIYEGQKGASNIHSQNAQNNQSINSEKNVLDFTLTYQQFILIQNSLPKKYALLEYKLNNPTNKRVGSGSAVKFNVNTQDYQIFNAKEPEAQNFSKLSANNTVNNNMSNLGDADDIDGRSKRPRPKKVDRFLQNQAPQKSIKRITSQRTVLNLDDQMMQCYNILVQVKKHKSAYPFLKPVDPKLDGAYNYLQIIKQPMDLSTVEGNLKNSEYQTAGQFHGDMNKIWLNSYAYNQKASVLYKLTIDIEKYYKNLCNNQGITKKTKVIQKSKQKDKSTTHNNMNKKDYDRISQPQFNINGGNSNKDNIKDKDNEKKSNYDKMNNEDGEFGQDSDEFMQ